MIYLKIGGNGMKRPKRVKVIFTEVKATTSKYTCPFCRVTFMGGVKPNVIKFICDCGNQLIVDKEATE